jgi:nucleoside-diphosphate-sugar epimerase
MRPVEMMIQDNSATLMESPPVNALKEDEFIVDKRDPVLVTGANGFIGTRVAAGLLKLGFQQVRCFARSLNSASRLKRLTEIDGNESRVEIVKGNLLSTQDCVEATKDSKVIFHLAAGRGEKSFPDAFMNSVVTTRNLLEAAASHGCLKRFVNVSSFSVYSNREKSHGRLLDESCPIEQAPALRGEPYCFAKVEQERIVIDYAARHGISYTIIRPGQVYGPGNEGITGRVGIGTFGMFLHLGGSNTIPLTYVDNCADAIILAGLKHGTDCQVFNVVDDDLPTSFELLRLFKRHVRSFPSLYVPHALSYALCYCWEKYSAWSHEQLPPVFNRKRWHAYWKRTTYTNEKIKKYVGWEQRVRTVDGLRLFFESCRARSNDA